jgi:hypothetical protein
MRRLSRFLFHTLSTMPKDTKPAKKNALRPVRTLSRVAEAFTHLEVTVAKTCLETEAGVDAGDKLEGTSKSASSAPVVRVLARVGSGESASQLEPDGNADTLQPDAITLEFLERDTMGTSWFTALQNEFDKPYFAKVCLFLVWSFLGSLLTGLARS